MYQLDFKLKTEIERERSVQKILTQANPSLFCNYFCLFVVQENQLAAGFELGSLEQKARKLTTIPPPWPIMRVKFFKIVALIKRDTLQIYIMTYLLGQFTTCQCQMCQINISKPLSTASFSAIESSAPSTFPNFTKAGCLILLRNFRVEFYSTLEMTNQIS